MIVIPIDVYKSLQNRDQILQNPYDTSLLNYNKEMAEVFADPSISDEEKYAKYDQIIKKIKNVLREKFEKNSVESKISNALSSTFAQLSPSIPISFPQIKTIKKKIINKAGKIKKIKNKNKETVKKYVKMEDDDDEKNSYYSTESRKESTKSEDVITKPSSSVNVQEQPSDKRITRKQYLEQNQSELYEYIKKNSKKFGITYDDKIIKEGTNMAFQGSDLGRFVSYLINGDLLSSRINKPAGYDQLFKIIKNDPFVTNIIEKSKQTGRGRNTKKAIKFRPKLWKIF